MKRPPKCQHTRCPTDYLAWHAWAEKKSRTHDPHQCPVCGLWAVWKPKPKTPPADTPLDTARRAWAEHMATCTRCVGGRDCPTGDAIEARLTKLAEADVPWDDTSFPNGNNCKGQG